MRTRRAAIAAALAVATLSVAGCGLGGGGGEDGAAAGGEDPVAAVPPAQGVAAGDSSGQAVASLGAAAADAPGEGAGSLDSYEAFGTPKDHFEQQVTDGAGDGGGASEATSGGGTADPGAVVPDVPQVPDPAPLVSVPVTNEPVPLPGGTPGGTVPPGGVTTGGGEAGSGEVPASPARAMEADFDVSGEPVVAREGDAIPPDTQQFVIERIGAKEVLLELSGGLLPDGTDSVTLKEGESVTLYNATAKRSYRIKLVDLRPARG
jgi:hypothetical protein